VLAAAGVKPIILPKSGLTEFTAHYHLERNHQGAPNRNREGADCRVSAYWPL
jgi:hypothetical protein